MDLYENSSSYPKVNAQNNLNGRTHYVEDSTLRFHHARILKAKATCDGLLFYLIESCSADMHNTKRIFRHVIFDIAGHTLSRPDLEHGSKTRAAAEKLMWQEMEKIDSKVSALAAVDRAEKYAAEDYARIREKINKA